MENGIPDGVNPDMYFFPTIQNFSNSYSRFRYRTEVLLVQSLIQKLNQNELDVIFTMLFDEQALKRYDVEYHIILRHRLGAFMPRNGLLSYKDKITFQDLKTRKFDRKPLKDHMEAVRHKEAFDFVWDLVKDQAPLSENIIKQIHDLVLADKREGRGVYRRVPVRICEH